jgi:N-methylhydantoinase A/oxoprolinase/acetone carboxylase beta subunit
MNYIGIDIGGTFTDIVLVDDRSIARTRQIQLSRSLWACWGSSSPRKMGVSSSELMSNLHFAAAMQPQCLHRTQGSTGLITTRLWRYDVYQRMMGFTVV